MLEKELQNLGLSEKESKVYMAVLDSGPETAQNIAKKADINRPTAYLQIESLKSKGLMSECQRGKKTFYSAESPNRLLNMLSMIEKDLDLKKTEMNRILPQLNDIFAGAGDRPKVRFFEGLAGAKAMQEDFLTAGDKKIEAFTNLDKLLEIFPKHETDYTKRRVAAGIETMVLYTRKDGPIQSANDPSKLRSTKHISSDTFPITADISIFDNKVAIATYKAKPVGVVIEDKDIAATMKAIFYLIWNSN